MEVRRLAHLTYLPELQHLAQPNVQLSVELVFSNSNLLVMFIFKMEVLQYSNLDVKLPGNGILIIFSYRCNVSLSFISSSFFLIA